MNSSRLGIYAGFGFKMPFAERIDLIKNAGFGATGIWWEEKHPQIRELRHQAPEMIRRAGLYLDNIHVPYFACRELWIADPQKRRDAIALHLQWIEDCSGHEIPRMVLHVSLGGSTPEPSVEGIDAFRELVEHAERRSVTLAIENTHQDRYIDCLLENIASDSLQLCFDTSHDHLYAREPGELLARWRHRLTALHLSDTDGRFDRHWLPGEGVVDFESLQPHWNGNFDGVYMLESVSKQKNETPQDFLKRAFASLGAAGPISV